MKEKLITFLQENLPNSIDVEKLLEKPKSESHGDFSLPCFLIAKETKQNPVDTAKKLQEELLKKKKEFISDIKAVGPFLNFYLNTQLEAQEVFNSIKNKSLFSFTVKEPKKILLEYPSPNTNKSLHLGHVRNMLLGNSLSKILKKVGHNIVKINLNNDKGVAMCKAMLAYKLYGEGKTPTSENIKGDKFVAQFYVLFSKKNEEHPDLELEKKAQEMLVQWEQGDEEVIKLWRQILNWVYDGYKETFNKFKISFDKEYHESKIYDKGKQLVVDALKKEVEGFGQEEDGAIYCDLTDIGLDKKYLVRKDGTTLYMTQDIYLADLKRKDFNPDRSVFVVANEQDYHFKVLFEILSRMGIAEQGDNYHLSYGYISLPEGKMKSRQGTVVDADDLLDGIIEQAKNNLLEKELTRNLSEKEIQRRAQIIGYGALAFFILKYNPVKDFIFDPKETLSFEGETGPYVQYTYARIQSILRKAKYKENFDIDTSVFEETEQSLIKLLKEYPTILDDASSKYKISSFAQYALRVAQSFNEMYQNSPFLKAKNEELKQARLLLAYSTGEILKDVLSLLDIEVLEEM